MTPVFGGGPGDLTVTARIANQAAEITFHAAAKAGLNALVGDWYDPDAGSPGEAWRLRPADVTVRSGGVVRWRFTYGPHWLVPSVGGTQPSMDAAAAGDHAEVFVTPGLFPYRCLLHPAETGVVRVPAPPPDH